MLTALICYIVYGLGPTGIYGFFGMKAGKFGLVLFALISFLPMRFVFDKLYEIVPEAKDAKGPRKNPWQIPHAVILFTMLIIGYFTWTEQMLTKTQFFSIFGLALIMIDFCYIFHNWRRDRDIRKAIANSVLDGFAVTLLLTLVSIVFILLAV